MDKTTENILNAKRFEDDPDAPLCVDCGERHYKRSGKSKPITAIPSSRRGHPMTDEVFKEWKDNPEFQAHYAAAVQWRETRLPAAEAELDHLREHVTELWHDNKIAVDDLHEALGMSEFEYANWVEGKPLDAPRPTNEPLDKRVHELIREALSWERKQFDGELKDTYSDERLDGMHHAFARMFKVLDVDIETIKVIAADMKQDTSDD